MKSFRLLTTFCLLLASACRIFAVPPMPQNVAQGSEGIRFLWMQVQDGVLYRALPADYRDQQAAWNEFLHNDGKQMINDYYLCVVSINVREAKARI